MPAMIHDDALAPARGLLIALAIGAAMWIAILLAIALATGWRP